MLIFYVLYSHKVVLLWFYKVHVGFMRVYFYILMNLYDVIWEDIGITLILCNHKVLTV